MSTAAGRPTLDTVAERAGVSRMTVSNTYNRPEQVAVATRERVLDAARELGYPGPDPTAASLRLRHTGTVGVVLTERLPYAFADPGIVTILHGIATELSTAGNALLLVPAAGPTGQSLLRQAMVDALILCSVPGDDPSVTVAVDRRLPLVTVGSPRLTGTPRIGPDNRAAARELGAHLVGLGHRRIAAVTAAGGATGPGPRPLFDERIQGMRDALAGVGGARLEVVVAQDNAREPGRDAVAALLARPASERPTAVFGVTDILALGALDAAAAARLPVPARLSVAGFDDVAAAATSAPALTTVAHDLFGQGRAAARLALRLVSGARVRAPHIGTRLVVRASTAPPPG